MFKFASNESGIFGLENGFFKNEYEKQLKNINLNEEITKLSKLKSDQERFQHVSCLKLFKNIQTSTQDGKNTAKAQLLKDLGNKQFGLKEYNSALAFYNKASVLIPNEQDSTNHNDLAVIIANRSAVFYYLNEFDLCLEDIDLALRNNYPDNLKYKLFERKLKCYINLEKQELVSKVCNDLQEALKHAKLDNKKKIDLENLIKKYSQVQNTQNGKSAKNDKTSHNHGKSILPEVTGKRNSEIATVSESVDVREEDSLGRYVYARSSIPVGHTILVERSCGAVLQPEFSATYCSFCFSRLRRIIPCKTCINVGFCSDNCHKQAEQFHNIECSILSDLWNAGLSIISQIALRIITEQNVSFFKQLTTTTLKDSNKQYGDAYWNIFNFVNHEKEMTDEKKFHLTAIAAFLIEYLKKTDYFNHKNKSKFHKDVNFIGGLILNLLKSLPFNTHEIFELKLNESEPNRPDLGKTITIGGAVYPTLALFNHSCDPSIVRYFNGTSVIVRTIKNIKPNEMICENYGAIFSQMPKPKRQEHLRQQYFFDCACYACVLDWPLFEELPDDVLRFRCSNSRCTNMMEINMSKDVELVINCLICKANLNVLKSLKILENTEEINQQAIKFLEDGKPLMALEMFIKKLKILSEVLVAPYKDFVVCQQKIRECMLFLGNKN